MNDFAAPGSSASPPQAPLTVGQILDRIYRLMRANLRLFTGIAAVPAITGLLTFAAIFAVVFLPMILEQQATPDPRMILHLVLPLVFASIPLSLAVFALYLAASIHAAMQANRGVTITFGEAYRTAWKHAGRYLWLLILCYIVAGLPALVMELLMIIPLQFFKIGESGSLPLYVFMIPLLLLLFLAAMLYGVLAALRLSLAFPVSLAEGLKAWPAIRRSAHLTHGAKGRIFLVFLIVYALAYVAEMVVFLVMGAVFGLAAIIFAVTHIHVASVAGVTGAGLAVVCMAGILFLWIALIWSAFSTAFAVLYHDQRLRNDDAPPTPVPTGEPA